MAAVRGLPVETGRVTNQIQVCIMKGQIAK